MTNNQIIAPQRLLSIDRLRGICIFLYLCSVVLGSFESLQFFQPIISHDPNIGWLILPNMTFADLFAPIFIFIVGLTFCKGMSSYATKHGYTKAVGKYALKSLAMIGFGAININGLSLFADWVLDSNAYTGFSIGDKIHLYLFLLALVVLVVWIISRLIRNDTFKKVSSLIMRWLWVVGGAISLCLLVISTAYIFTGTARIEVWDVLQTIGLAMLIATPFALLGKYAKLITSAAILLMLALFYQSGGYTAVGSVILNGGFVGGFGWAVLVLLGGFFVDCKDNKIELFVGATALIAIALILALAFDFVVAKRGATPPYVLFCGGIGALLFAILRLFDNYQPKIVFFTIWGRNSMTVYYAGAIISQILGMLMPADLHVALAILISLVVIGAFFAVVLLLNKRQKFVRL